MKRLLGIDLGEARIGLAVSDESRSLATGYGFIAFKGYQDLAEQISAICDKENVKGVVIGLPLKMDGMPGPAAAKARKLADILKAKTNLEVHLMDERLTTVEAARQIHASGKKARKGRLDEVAATIILQAFIDGKEKK